VAEASISGSGGLEGEERRGEARGKAEQKGKNWLPIFFVGLLRIPAPPLSLS